MLAHLVSNDSENPPRRSRKSCLGCLALLIGVPAVLIVGYLVLCEWSFRRYVEMGGQRNHLTCDVRTTDGSTLPEVTLIFSASDGFSYIPLSRLAGGSDDRTIKQTYRLKTSVPGSVAVEWPRLYMRLMEVHIGDTPAAIDWQRGSLVACWDNVVRRYAPDGHPTGETGGSYTATVLIEPIKKTVTVTRLDK